MTSQRSDAAPVCHYRIYVYQNAGPPLGRPTAVSLCPQARIGDRTLSGVLAQVNCPQCLAFLETIGLTS